MRLFDTVEISAPSSLDGALFVGSRQLSLPRLFLGFPGR